MIHAFMHIICSAFVIIIIFHIYFKTICDTFDKICLFRNKKIVYDLQCNLQCVHEGIFGILKQLLHLSARVRQTEQEREEEDLRQSPTQTLLNCFMLGWFIIGK